MTFRRTTLYVAVAGLVLVASTLGGSGVVAHADGHTETPAGDSEVTDAERLLQQLDTFLETVADLLRTVREIAEVIGATEGED
ncbi:hypothetical protein EGH21_20915 [Halomicroarcula sp. F13]|uniref:Secreted protein n=1 Tax=Haloarcula rubra TaxID=2487747 RepID=A0AAW4PUY3_9EURY|nr:hypothetical protein [Halomicroarcula rubra]MBX0325493.1 hypothetical protein [Halomicroarcula rubra]